MRSTSKIPHGREWHGLGYGYGYDYGHGAFSFIHTHRYHNIDEKNSGNDNDMSVSISSSPLKNTFLYLRGGGEPHSSGSGSGSGDIAGNDIIATFREELKRMREEFEKEAQIELQAAKEDIVRRKEQEKEQEHDGRIRMLQMEQQEQEQAYLRQLREQEQQQQLQEKQHHSDGESEEIIGNSVCIEEIEGDEVVTDASEVIYDTDFDNFIVGDTDENDEDVLEKLLLRQKENENKRNEKGITEQGTTLNTDFIDKVEDGEDEGFAPVIRDEDGLKNATSDSEENSDNKRPHNDNFQDDERSQKSEFEIDQQERDSVKPSEKKRKKKNNAQRKKRRKKKKQKEFEKLEHEYEYETLTDQQAKEWHEKLTSTTQKPLESKEDNSTTSILTIAIKSLIPTIVVAFLLIVSHIFFEALLKKV